MEPAKKKSEGYTLYMITFVALSVLTLLAVGLTQVRLSPASATTLILLVATLQAGIVLIYNMHLKFNDKILLIFTIIIFSLIFLTILVTLVDYIYR